MFPEFLKEYLPIILFLLIAFGLSCAFVIVNYILSPKNPDPEKLSAYECGFEPFQDSRMEFDVRFYLVAILFIIFDLEIAFLFPWAISLGNIGLLGFISIFLYKNRLLQYRLCLLNMYFQICPIIYICSYISMKSCMPQFLEMMGFYLIFLIFICYGLAAIYIKKDNDLIKSIDRI